jgi:hypothetical protein
MSVADGTRESILAILAIYEQAGQECSMTVVEEDE